MKMKKIFLPVGGMILVFFGTLFLLIPRLGKVASLMKQNKKLTEERRVFLQKAQLIASLDENELRESGRLAALALPKEKDVSLVLYALGTPARNNSFYIDKLEFSLGEIVSPQEESTKEKKEVKRTEEILVKISLVGPGARLFSLLKEMEEALPILSIGNLEVRYGAGNKATVKMNLTFFLSSKRSAYETEKLTIKDLTLSDEEEALLAKLREAKKDSYIVNLIQGDIPYTGSFGRENPFSLR